MNLTLTAATLRAMLCYIDPNNTRKIAYDTDDKKIIEALINRVKHSVGDRDGIELVNISFHPIAEAELIRQFVGVTHNIFSVFQEIARKAYVV